MCLCIYCTHRHDLLGFISKPVFVYLAHTHQLHGRFTCLPCMAFDMLMCWLMKHYNQSIQSCICVCGPYRLQMVACLSVPSRCTIQVAEKHGSLKVVVYEGLKWHHRQAEEDKKITRKMPSNKNKAAVSFHDHCVG